MQRHNKIHKKTSKSIYATTSDNSLTDKKLEILKKIKKDNTIQHPLTDIKTRSLYDCTIGKAFQVEENSTPRRLL